MVTWYSRTFMHAAYVHLSLSPRHAPHISVFFPNVTHSFIFKKLELAIGLRKDTEMCSLESPGVLINTDMEQHQLTNRFSVSVLLNKILDSQHAWEYCNMS